MKGLAQKSAEMRERMKHEAPPKVVVLQPPAPHIVISALPDSPDTLPGVQRFLEWFWSFTPCWVCEEYGPCIHREPDVDIARAEGWFQTLQGKRK